MTSHVETLFAGKTPPSVDGEDLRQAIVPRADVLARLLVSRGASAGQCIGVVERDASDTLAAMLAIRRIRAIAYFVPPDVSVLRRRFLCESASISMVLDTSCGSDVNSLGTLDDCEARSPESFREFAPQRAVVRIHLRHASGKLLAAEVYQTVLSRKMAVGVQANSAQTAWSLCGLSPLALSTMVWAGEERDGDFHTAAEHVLSMSDRAFPLPGVVLNGKRLSPVGTPGELCLGGLRLRAPDEIFVVEHPLLKGQRWVRTGWRAAQAKDGSWRLLDGSKDERAALESRLAKGSEAVLRSGWKDQPIALVPRQGLWTVFAERGEPRSFAFVDLLARLKREQRPQWLPAALILKEKLPLLSHGAVDRDALLNEKDDAAVVVEAPQGPTEELLADIWNELVKCGRTDRRANFFQLGGASLTGTQLVSRIRDAFGVELTLRELFEQQTLQSQARLIEVKSGNGERLPAIVTVDRTKPLPLSFAQQRLWFLSRMMRPSSVYNIPLALPLRGQVNEAALLQSLNEIVRRHEALRTRFVDVQGDAVQVIDAASDNCVVVEDIHSEEALRA